MGGVKGGSESFPFLDPGVDEGGKERSGKTYKTSYPTFHLSYSILNGDTHLLCQKGLARLPEMALNNSSLLKQLYMPFQESLNRVALPTVPAEA